MEGRRVTKTKERKSQNRPVRCVRCSLDFSKKANELVLCVQTCIPVPNAFLYNSSTSSVSLLACTSLTSSSARSSDRRRDLRRDATSRAGLCCRTARTGGVGPLEETRARRVEAGERDDRDDLSVT